MDLETIKNIPEGIPIPDGTIVRLRDNQTWGPDDYGWAITAQTPLPEHNQEYTVIGSKSEVCSCCGNIRNFIGLAELPGKKSVFDREFFEIIRPPMDVDEVLGNIL